MASPFKGEKNPDFKRIKISVIVGQSRFGLEEVKVLRPLQKFPVTAKTLFKKSQVCI